MNSALSLASLKAEWNRVLDKLLETNRIAWLSYFDARLASLEGDLLKLDFADADKFQDGHNFQQQRHPELLEQAIFQVTGVKIRIAE